MRSDLTVASFSLVSVRSDLLQVFILPKNHSIFKRFPWSSSTPHLSLMGSYGIVADKPFVEVILQFLYGGIEELAESHLVEFIEND